MTEITLSSVGDTVEIKVSHEGGLPLPTKHTPTPTPNQPPEEEEKELKLASPVMGQNSYIKLYDFVDLKNLGLEGSCIRRNSVPPFDPSQPITPPPPSDNPSPTALTSVPCQLERITAHKGFVYIKVGSIVAKYEPRFSSRNGFILNYKGTLQQDDLDSTIFADSDLETLKDFCPGQLPCEFLNKRKIAQSKFFKANDDEKGLAYFIAWYQGFGGIGRLMQATLGEASGTSTSGTEGGDTGAEADGGTGNNGGDAGGSSDGSGTGTEPPPPPIDVPFLTQFEKQHRDYLARFCAGDSKLCDGKDEVGQIPDAKVTAYEHTQINVRGMLWHLASDAERNQFTETEVASMLFRAYDNKTFSAQTWRKTNTNATVTHYYDISVLFSKLCGRAFDGITIPSEVCATNTFDSLVYFPHSKTLSITVGNYHLDFDVRLKVNNSDPNIQGRLEIQMGIGIGSNNLGFTGDYLHYVNRIGLPKKVGKLSGLGRFVNIENSASICEESSCQFKTRAFFDLYQLSLHVEGVTTASSKSIYSSTSETVFSAGTLPVGGYDDVFAA
ncbi:MAG: hypothetical protein KBD78_16305, partial [Oligoflexales bacterium]|nr:hypothetical protein [Oligoflexales bacterium]